MESSKLERRVAKLEGGVDELADSISKLQKNILSLDRLIIALGKWMEAGDALKKAERELLFLHPRTFDMYVRRMALVAKLNNRSRKKR
jgi:predicted  nucleic acid-binding Zn-ribbon protein